MANPNDIPLEVFRAGMEAALRGTMLMLERQQRLLSMQLKAVDQAVAGTKEIFSGVAHAGSMADLAALPAALLRQQTEQYTRLCEACTAMASHNQTALAEQMREAGETWQKLQGNAVASGAGVQGVTTPSMQELFDRFGQFNSVLANAFLAPMGGGAKAAGTHDASAAQSTERGRTRRGE